MQCQSILKKIIIKHSSRSRPLVLIKLQVQVNRVYRMKEYDSISTQWKFEHGLPSTFLVHVPVTSF